MKIHSDPLAPDARGAGHRRRPKAATATRIAALARVWVALCLAAPAVLADEPLGPGDRLPAVSLEDAHGEIHAIGPDVRRVLFSRDMDGGRVVKAALEDGGDVLLERSDAVYVSDIAGMPTIITRMFALPAMRRRPYTMLLDRDGEATARWPSEPGRATLITLRNATIASVEVFEEPAALRDALEAAAQPPSVEEEILRLEERRYRALVGADALALDVVLDPELVYTHSNGAVQGKAELIEALEQGRLDYRSVESRVEGVSIAGEAAIVSGRAEMAVAAGGEPRDLAVRFTAVYVRRDGRWRLLAYQSTGIDGP